MKNILDLGRLGDKARNAFSLLVRSEYTIPNSGVEVGIPLMFGIFLVSDYALS